MPQMFATAGSAKPAYAVLIGLQQLDRRNRQKRYQEPDLSSSRVCMGERLEVIPPRVLFFLGNQELCSEG